MEPKNRTTEKKVRLFLSPLNPLWGWRCRLENTQNATAQRAKFLGTSDTNLVHWTRGMAPAGLRSRLDALCENLEEVQTKFPRESRTAQEFRHRVRAFSSVVLDDEVRVYEAGAILGMSGRLVQRAIDYTFQLQEPLLSAAYYNTDDGEWETVANTYSGVYRAWVERQRDGVDFVLQGSFEVRFALDPVPRKTVVRTKLTLPAFQLSPQVAVTSARPWSYDGFVRVLGQRLFVTLDKRARLGQDFFSFATDAGVIVDAATTLVGRYLTTDQDWARSVVTGRIILHRHAELEPEDPGLLKQPQLADFLAKHKEGNRAELLEQVSRALEHDRYYGLRTTMQQWLGVARTDTLEFAENESFRDYRRVLQMLKGRPGDSARPAAP